MCRNGATECTVCLTTGVTIFLDGDDGGDGLEADRERAAAIPDIPRTVTIGCIAGLICHRVLAEGGEELNLRVVVWTKADAGAGTRA